MSVEQIAIVGLAAALIAVTYVFLHETSNIRKLLKQEEKWRREQGDDARSRHWALRDEVSSGFEALGLERRPARPAMSAGWSKKY